MFLVVFVPLALLYASTAHLTSHTHIDPMTNAVTAWHIGMTGSVALPDHDAATVGGQVGNVGWIVESPRGPVSQYPPGAAFLAAPFYWVSGEPMTDWLVEGLNRPDAESIPFPLPSPAPAAIAAALAAAGAVAFAAASIPYAGGSRLVAITAGYVGGLGTTMWANAADALWQHGPASLWLALGIYLAARSQLWWAGLAFGGAILTRPPTALIAAGVGLALALSQRRLRPAFSVGAGSLAGLAALLWYNFWLWGEASVSGGYGAVFTERLANNDLFAFAENLIRFLVDPTHGLLVYSPFLLFLIPGIRAGWRRVPDWGRGAAIGAAVYLLVQLKVNRSSGGTGFLGYRYPLEALTASASLLTLAYVYWVNERPLVRRLFWGGVGIALLLQVNWKAGIVPINGDTGG